MLESTKVVDKNDETNLILCSKQYQIYRNKKSNLHYTRGITQQRVSSGEAHHRGLAPWQHSSEKTSQRWRAVSDTVPDLTGAVIETKTSHTVTDIFNYSASEPNR